MYQDNSMYQFTGEDNNDNSQSLGQPSVSAKSHSFFGWLLLIVLVFAVLTAYLTQHIYVMDISMKMQSLEKKVTKLKRENELLEIDLAKYTRMATIDHLAINKLGMIRPDHVEYLIVRGTN